MWECLSGEGYGEKQLWGASLRSADEGPGIYNYPAAHWENVVLFLFLNPYVLLLHLYCGLASHEC